MSDTLDAAAERLRAVGWKCIPPVDPNAEIQKPEEGQVWVSPKPRTSARTVTKVAPHRWYPSGDMCVYFTTPDGRSSALHHTRWNDWARKSQARPEMTDELHK